LKTIQIMQIKLQEFDLDRVGRQG